MNDTYIHPTANVASNSKIGHGTKVWINVQIRENVTIGNDCIISKDVYIDHGVTIGNRCKIQNSVSVYNGVTIFDDVFVGPHVSFTNDRVPRAFNNNWKITPTIVNSGVSLGANSTIVCGVSLGSYSMIAAGSVVTKDVPRHALVVGNPAKVVAYVCECGNKLDVHANCSLCKKSFDIDEMRANK
jgi:acetyltransferase-like isoleucine patch superfamily enzyme